MDPKDLKKMINDADARGRYVYYGKTKTRLLYVASGKAYFAFAKPMPVSLIKKSALTIN